jgi:hypothetical protein
VDLVQASRTATREKREQDLRQAKRLGIAARAPDPAAKSRKSGFSTEPRQYSIAELRQASQGVPEIAFMAACYAFAGDNSCLWRLHAALAAEAAGIAKRESWPGTVRDRHNIAVPYLEHLAKLVLDEDRYRYSAQFPGVTDVVYTIYMGMSPRTWRRELAGRFIKVQSVWHEWLCTAGAIMQPRLSTETEA